MWFLLHITITSKQRDGEEAQLHVRAVIVTPLRLCEWQRAMEVVGGHRNGANDVANCHEKRVMGVGNLGIPVVAGDEFGEEGAAE